MPAAQSCARTNTRLKFSVCLASGSAHIRLAHAPLPVMDVLLVVRCVATPLAQNLLSLPQDSCQTCVTAKVVRFIDFKKLQSTCEIGQPSSTDTSSRAMSSVELWPSRGRSGQRMDPKMCHHLSLFFTVHESPQGTKPCASQSTAKRTVESTAPETMPQTLVAPATIRTFTSWHMSLMYVVCAVLRTRVVYSIHPWRGTAAPSRPRCHPSNGQPRSQHGSTLPREVNRQPTAAGGETAPPALQVCET